MTSGVRIDGRFQGPTGSGQGGWTAHRFESAVGRPLAVSIRTPIPLEEPLSVERDGAGAEQWHLVGGRDVAAPVTIMTGVPRTPLGVMTSPVSISAAAAANQRFGRLVDDHPVPECFSCGLRADSMRVHAAPLDDGTGRYATDWHVPGWAVSATGVDEGVVWAALDCAAAWFVSTSHGRRTAFTVQIAVEMLEALAPDETYALVSWSGGAPDRWDGRKRHAASAAFGSDGTCVARSTSLWVSVEE